MMQQVKEQPDIHVISRQGQRVLETIAQELKKEHLGRFIAIEVDSGDYFIGDTAIEATQQAQTRHPGNLWPYSFLLDRAVFIGYNNFPTKALRCGGWNR